jgi:hypothetical protein
MKPSQFAPLLMALSLPLAAAGPPRHAMAEVEGVLEFLAESDCRFYRNGKWYSGMEARSHLEMKYDFMVRRNLLHSTEDFIRGAAERSSVSGEPYRVKCPDEPVQPSAVWLRHRIEQMRVARHERKR